MPPRHLGLLPLLLVVGACTTSEPTACDGFADRKLAISGAEYRPCAGEILAALDAVEPLLSKVVSGTADKNDLEAARRAYGKLRTRIRRTGIEADYWGRPGSQIVKWPDGAVRVFNSAAFTATVEFGAVLNYPNADNFDQGVRAHEEARGYYYSIR